MAIRVDAAIYDGQCQHEGNGGQPGNNQGGSSSRLERNKMGGSRTVLERKHQAGGGDGGMSIFINFEAGHLEIGSFINESAILCAHQEMF